MTIEILYQDDYLVVINKPSGLLVHRSDIDRHETRFALQITRDLLDRRLYPVHRLDKPTSGTLMFALNSDVARRLSALFEVNAIEKSYLAVVRGYTPSSGDIDYPLSIEPGTQREKARAARIDHVKSHKSALTHYQRIATIELDISIEKYPTSRYSLVNCHPRTGRKHQLRRHFKHISHPIIGDSTHGRGRHNRYFKESFGVDRLLLHAYRLRFKHPLTEKTIAIDAPLRNSMATLMQKLKWQQAVHSLCSH